jgi:hypothetical protein
MVPLKSSKALRSVPHLPFVMPIEKRKRIWKSVVFSTSTPL